MNLIKKIGLYLLCVFIGTSAWSENGELFMVSDQKIVPAYDLPDGFVYVRDYIPDVIEEMRYAGTHNFTGEIVDGYEQGYAIMTKQAAGHLAQAADELRLKGYRLKIYDAYRPKRAVAFFVDWSEKEEDGRTREEFYPDFRDRTELVDRGYIARNSAHTRGSAVDLTLTDLEGNDLDMGTCFDYFGQKAWHACRDITPEQKQNRELLRTTMEKYGFRPFKQEWWHYKLIGEPFPEKSFDFIVH